MKVITVIDTMATKKRPIHSAELIIVSHIAIITADAVKSIHTAQYVNKSIKCT